MRHWQWLLDTALPGELGQVGEWVNRGEALVYAEDIPNELNEESAAVLSQKIDDHKHFFNDYESVKEQAARLSKDTKLLQNVPREQMISLMTRLQGIGHKAGIRAVRLKFLEHKVLSMSFLISDIIIEFLHFFLMI